MRGELEPGSAQSAPAQDAEPARACAFCVEGAADAEGHAGLALQMHEVDKRLRSPVTATCVFCGSRWVRRRLRAKIYEWLRLAH